MNGVEIALLTVLAALTGKVVGLPIVGLFVLVFLLAARRLS